MIRSHKRAVGVMAAMLVAATACSDESTGSAGGGDGPVSIGLLAPLTGADAQTAQIVENTLRLGAEQVNEEGGINGRDLELEVYDDEHEPELAAQNAQRAITQDQVSALIGPWSSSEAMAVAEVVERSEVVDINYSAATPEITEGRDFVFRTSPVTDDLALGMVQLADALGAENAVFLYDSGGFGLGAKDPVEAAADAAGYNLTESIQYTINSTDVGTEVQRAARTDPDAVIIAGSTGADHGLVAKAMVEQGLDVPLIGMSPIVLPDAVDISAGAYEELPSVHTLQAADTTKDSYTELLDAYNEAYDPVENLPEQVLGAWDALWFLVDGLKETDGEGGVALAEALEELDPRPGVNGRDGTDQSFSPDDHDANQENYLVPYRIEAGEPVQDTEVELE